LSWQKTCQEDYGTSYKSVAMPLPAPALRIPLSAGKVDTLLLLCLNHSLVQRKKATVINSANITYPNNPHEAFLNYGI